MSPGRAGCPSWLTLRRTSFETPDSLTAQCKDKLIQRNFLIVQDAFISTVRTTGMIFLIVLAAFTLSFAFARLGISQQIAEAISGLGLNDWQLVLVLVVFYLVLGTFMESFAMMVTTVPILLPTLEGAGVDLVWFGVIMVLLVEAALISPPEGINLYVLHGVRLDVDREQAERANEGVATKHHRRRMDRGASLHGLHGHHHGFGAVHS